MRISIIVPVFNAEPYLEECVNSLLAQGLTDYEIILVNDGSTDDSGAVCDAYAARYPAIKVIHKENSGVSDARNAGLRAVTGDYVVFVDSDDYLAESALSDVAKRIGLSGADVVFFDAIKVFPDGRKVPLGDGYDARSINGRSKHQVLEHMSRLPKFPGSAWAKMVRTELVRRHSLYFERYSLSEDIDWSVRLLLKGEVFFYCGGQYYFYRQRRPGSITASINVEHVRDLFSIIKKWASRDLSRPFQREVNAFMAYEYAVLLLHYARLNPMDAKSLANDIKAYEWLLRYGRNWKTHCVRSLVQIAGLDMSAWLLSVCKSYHL